MRAIARGRVRLVLLLVAASLAPASVLHAETAPLDPSQEATFQVFVRGVAIGTEQAEISRTERGWLISSTTRLAPPLDLILNRAEARYSADWHPLELVLLGTRRDEIVDLATTFSGTSAKSKFFENGGPAEKTDTVAADTVILPNNFFAAYAALGVRALAAPAGTGIRAYIAPRGEMTMTLENVSAQRLQTRTATFAVRRLTLSAVQPDAAPVAIELWVDEQGRLVRFSIPAAGLDVIRQDVAAVGTREQTSYREGDEQVTIPASGFNLAATISRPVSAATPEAKPASNAAPPRFPAIVLVAGSGSRDRDEVVEGIPVFGQLASSLADAGFLVVRYDKRGIGQSGGRVEAVTLNDYAEDAVSVVRWLARRKDVDDRRIFVVGRDEGAWVALIAAAREKKIARVALVAAPGVRGADLVLEQQRRTLDQSQLSDADKQARIELQQKIHQAVTSGSGWEGVPDEVRRQADTPWFASLLAFDPSAAIAKVRQPILIVQAERDAELPASHGEKLAALARARRKAAPVATVTIPAVDHLFVRASPERESAFASLGEKTISPALGEAVAGWLQQTVGSD